MENKVLDVAEMSKIILSLKEEMNYLKEQLEDITLSNEDILAANSYKKEKEKGQLISSEELNKELGLNAEN